MKKIVLTQEQTDKLINKIINEQTQFDPNIHSVEIKKCEFNYNNVIYKGKEINDIALSYRFNIQYRVEPEYRKYGIKTISVYAINGPSEIDVDIDYYGRTPDPENLSDDGEVQETIKFPIDWDKMVIIKEDESLPYFGVNDQDVEIELNNDQEGNLVIKNIILYVKNF